MGFGLEALKGRSVVNARICDGCQSARSQKWLISHAFFSMPLSRDTLPTKVQRTLLGFIHIKADLGLRVAVNEKAKDATHKYQQVRVSRKPVLYAS